MNRPDPARLAPWIVILAGVSAALHVGKLPPAVPVLQAELGISLVQAGFLLAFVQLAGMLLGLVAGLLADGVGLRRSMLTGLLILGGASLAGLWARDAGSLMFLRAAEGLGFLLSTVPAPGLLRRLVPPQRLLRTLGIWSAYMPFGMSLALLLGPAVIAASGWRSWWLLTALASAGMAWAVWRGVPADAAQSGSGPAGSPPVAVSAWTRRLAQTLGAPGPWLAALCFAVYSAQWLAVIGFLPTLYRELDWGPALAASLTASVAAANIVGNVLAGRSLQRGGSPLHLLWAGFAAMAVGTWLSFSDVAAAWPLLRYGGALLFSLLGGLIPGTLFGLAPRLAPGEDTIASTVGWMQQCSSIGQMTGPPLVAWVASRSGSWDHTWWVTVGLCVAGVLLARGVHGVHNRV